VWTELGSLALDARRLLDELESLSPAGCRAVAGECAPAFDVLETPEQYELVMDLPGVTAEALRVFIKEGTVVVVGRKLPREVESVRTATFHRAERSFGRFARAARLPGAVDGGRARGTIRAGELRIVVPKLADRRGREIRVPLE
jgi:HSP20 family protein